MPKALPLGLSGERSAAGIRDGALERVGTAITAASLRATLLQVRSGTSILRRRKSTQWPCLRARQSPLQRMVVSRHPTMADSICAALAPSSILQMLKKMACMTVKAWSVQRIPPFRPLIAIRSDALEILPPDDLWLHGWDDQGYMLDFALIDTR